jgi:ABC transporter, phosphonate, periplasmic substrate-binding protein
VHTGALVRCAVPLCLSGMVIAAGPVPSVPTPPPPEQAAARASLVIVVCAPGFPGNTAQAQPTMDRFATAVGAAAGRPAGAIGALYFETEAAGLTQLAKPQSGLALVPLPFFLKHADALQLEPRLTAVQAGGPAQETWSLVAQRGRVGKAADLAGWEVTGATGYAPAFVRGIVLGRWGALPDSVRITFSAAPLAALRRAAAGETVAVVLDGAQTAALPSLPFGADLEVVARSRPLPGSLLCLVGDRLGDDGAGAILRALLHLHDTAAGAEILPTMRIVRFEAVDRKALAGARQAYAAGGAR